MRVGRGLVLLPNPSFYVFYILFIPRLKGVINMLIIISLCVSVVALVNSIIALILIKKAANLLKNLKMMSGFFFSII